MSWIEDPEFAEDKPFGPQTLPYGAVAGAGLAVRVGEHALLLRPLASALGERLAELVAADTLDPLLAAGRGRWEELRSRLVELVSAASAPAGATLVGLPDLD